MVVRFISITPSHVKSEGVGFRKFRAEMFLLERVLDAMGSENCCSGSICGVVAAAGRLGGTGGGCAGSGLGGNGGGVIGTSSRLGTWYGLRRLT